MLDEMVVVEEVLHLPQGGVGRAEQQVTQYMSCRSQTDIALYHA
jgi:hypothetical protein